MKKFLFISLPVLIAMLILPAFTPLKNTAAAQRFEKLGERKVKFKSDKDAISGRWDGWYQSLKIKVRGGSINMQKMVVHFRNGETEEIPLKNSFNDGDESRVIDLPGTRRLIEKVVFWYEATGSEGNKPVIELWGRHY